MRRKWLLLWYILLLLLIAEIVFYGIVGCMADYRRGLVRRQFNAGAAVWQEIDKVPYADIINRWSRRQGISASLVAAVIKAESSFQPLAESPAGAVGLMQIIPSTWQEINAEIKACEGRHNGLCTAKCYRDPELNIQIGTAYLCRLHHHYQGNMTLVVAAYNAGPGAVDRAGGIPVNGETEKYVERVIANWCEYSRTSTADYGNSVDAMVFMRKMVAWAIVCTLALLVWTMRRLNKQHNSWRWR